MIQVTKIVLRVCFVIGAVLVVINMYGLFSSLRNDEIYEENTYFKNDIILTEEQVFDAINAEIDDKKLYVIEVNQAISDGIAHYWDDEGIHTYNLRVPYYENYLLYAASYIKPEIYLKYEFMGYKRAIERGVGLCSQHAIIMAEVLEIAKIPSKIVGLSGHVVVTALVDYNGDEWWIIDPDYGVIIPHSLSDIEQEPQIIVPFYAKRGGSLGIHGVSSYMGVS